MLVPEFIVKELLNCCYLENWPEQQKVPLYSYSVPEETKTEDQRQLSD